MVAQNNSAIAEAKSARFMIGTLDDCGRMVSGWLFSVSVVVDGKALRFLAGGGDRAPVHAVFSMVRLRGVLMRALQSGREQHARNETRVMEF